MAKRRISKAGQRAELTAFRVPRLRRPVLPNILRGADVPSLDLSNRWLDAHVTTLREQRDALAQAPPSSRLQIDEFPVLGPGVHATRGLSCLVRLLVPVRTHFRSLLSVDSGRGTSC
jgi:hypothetical protein